jgi:hypothetical protein
MPAAADSGVSGGTSTADVTVAGSGLKTRRARVSAYELAVAAE